MLKKKENILFGLSCLFVMFIIVPLITATFFMFPSADDFSNTNSVIATGGNILYNTLKLTKSSYLGWQGTYFSLFVIYFLSNLIKGNIIGYRIVCIVNIILLLSGIFYLIRLMLREIVKEYRNYIVNIIFGITILMITLGHYVNESLYWFTGVCVYTIPLTCSIWGLAFLIKYNFYQKKRFIYVAYILLFCAVGGALQITALTCGILLGIVLITFKQKNKHNLIAFVVGLIGAFINVLTPGYYSRHEKIDDEYHILDAVISASKSVLNAMKNHLSSIIIVFGLLILVGMGYYWGKKVKSKICFKHILGLAIYLGMGLVIVDFPVYLGYGAYFPARCLFIENVAVSITFIILSVLIGAWLSKRNILQKKSMMASGMVAIAALLLIIKYGNFEVVNYPVLNIWNNFVNGNVTKYVEDNKDIYEKLQEGEGKDIVIKELPNCMGIYPQIGLFEDSEMWTNKTIAKYYSVKSIKLQMHE